MKPGLRRRVELVALFLASVAVGVAIRAGATEDCCKPEATEFLGAKLDSVQVNGTTVRTTSSHGYVVHAWANRPGDAGASLMDPATTEQRGMELRRIP
jgi:hypothetical protein